MKFHAYRKEERVAVMDLQVIALEDETDRIRVATFAAAGGEALAPWTPGAHVTFETPQGARSYSLIRWPDDTAPGYRVAIQREDAGDGGSVHMHGLRVGDRVKATGPENDFALGAHADTLLLAGGIGVTPLISMATALSQEGRASRFVYAGRSRAVMGFADAVEAAFGAEIRADDTNPLDLSALMAGLAPDTHVYLCGPKGMIDAARAAAASAGLPETQVHIELFATPQAEAGDTPFEVELSSSGQVFTIPPGQSIIEVLEAGGVDLVHDCQRGDCGICQTDVISGTPDHRDVVLSEAERASGTVMQICVSRALSPRLVLDL